MLPKILKKMIGSVAKTAPAAATAKQIRGDFDSAYYRRYNPDLVGVVDPVMHYGLVGWRERRDPAEWFSVVDYLADYPDVAAADVDPFRHYLAHGRSEGRTARYSRGSDKRAEHDFFHDTGMHLTTFPKAFDVDAYAMAAGLPDGQRWPALAHFVHHGVAQPRLLAAAQAGPNLLRAIGDVAEHGDLGKALKCFELAAQQGASDAALMRKLGDCRLRAGQPLQARQAYLSAAEQDPTHYWTFQHLGSICFDLGEFDDAVRHFKAAARLRPEKHQPRLACQRAAAEQFQLHWARANGLTLGGGDGAAAEAIAAAVTEYRDTFATQSTPLPFARKRPSAHPRIAIFGSDGLPQCRLYRIVQKIDQLAAVDQRVDFYPLSQAEAFGRRVALYDIVIVYRAPATPEVIDVLLLAQRFDVCTFYDIDDLIFDEAHYPPSRAELDGMVTPAEYAGLVTGRVLFRDAMALCDYGIASTPPLQAAIAAVVRCGVCFLSRNALGEAHLREVARHARRKPRAGGKFVFFYGSGSRSHNANFAIMAPALAAALRRRPNAELRVIGPVTLGPAFDGLGRQIVRLPFTADLTDYWRELGEADVNLAPLTHSVFNDGKSEIKWMEAAMLGIPSVVSSSAVYDDLARSGEDCFVARDASAWGRILERVMADPALCKRVGAAARTRVLSDYALRPGGEHLRAILQEGLADHAARRPLPDATRPLVLVVNIFYPPEFIGGATRVVEQTVTDIAAAEGRPFEIEVFCGREFDGRPGALDRYTWEGVPVTSLSPFDDVDSIERSVRTADMFDAYLDFVRPDLIHFHCIQRLGASLVDVARAKDIPYVVSAHDGWWISDRQFLIDDAGVPVYESGKWGDRHRLERLKHALDGAAATIAVSQTQARLYRERGIDNVVTIANGSETLTGVGPAPADGPVRLGLLGGLGLAKGADLLRQVLLRRRYANLSFLLVDHGMLEGARRYEMWGDNEVELVGKASFSTVARIYDRLHVVLAISVCVESFGLVAREARRLGRWVIASERGGMAEDVIPGENGFVIDPSTAADLVRVLDAIDADPARYRTPPPPAAALRGRGAVTADLMALYRTVLGRREDIGTGG